MKNISSEYKGKLLFPYKHEAFLSICRLQYHRERKKKSSFPLLPSEGQLYGICATFSSWTFDTLHLIPKLSFQLQEAKGTHSDVAFGHRQLLCGAYLWFQHSWTTWAFPSFCQERLHHSFLDLHAALLFPSLTCTPLSFIYVVGLAAASVYCWCLSLCTDCCSLLM